MSKNTNKSQSNILDRSATMFENLKKDGHLGIDKAAFPEPRIIKFQILNANIEARICISELIRNRTYNKNTIKPRLMLTQALLDIYVQVKPHLEANKKWRGNVGKNKKIPPHAKERKEMYDNIKKLDMVLYERKALSEDALIRIYFAMQEFLYSGLGITKIELDETYDPNMAFMEGV